jgi:hypothetical protein
VAGIGYMQELEYRKRDFGLKVCWRVPLELLQTCCKSGEVCVFWCLG